ncbi:ISPD [Symbiodinium pilosum]|uniref:ISPD protein n=1 Tax=Symbiodinium pilosum TaxID=2952 RepID=A0A812TAK6_SYMPI|nr:ISPD [Symbiodinium pilosum]
MSTRLQEMQRQNARRPQDEAGADATLKQRYPRRWYDSIMPFQPPWDNRPTVGEVRERLEAQTNNAAASLPEHSCPSEQTSTKAGTIVFWLVVLVLAVAPILARLQLIFGSTLNGPISSTCFESESSECEVVPYPRIALYCALAIVMLFKACSVDMTCGPWGAMPPMFTPAFGRTSSLDFVQQAAAEAVLSYTSMRRHGQLMPSLCMDANSLLQFDIMTTAQAEASVHSTFQ